MSKFAGKNVLGIIMTGMGDDGARSLKEMHDAGAPTFAEDESTCVVFGMPKEAIKLGAVDKTVALNHIATEITLLSRRFAREIAARAIPRCYTGNHPAAVW